MNKEQKEKLIELVDDVVGVLRKATEHVKNFGLSENDWDIAFDSREDWEMEMSEIHSNAEIKELYEFIESLTSDDKIKNQK